MIWILSKPNSYLGWYLASAGGAVVVYKASAVLMDLTVEQTAS